MLYGRVVVPFEVLMELESGSDRDESASIVRNTPGLEITEALADISPLLVSEIDMGEAAVLQMALHTEGATVVLDDLKARRVAKRVGIPFTGSLGVLLDAKRQGHLPSVSDAIARLRARGAWLSDSVVARALQIADEAS